jgi:hypothetical protein
MEKRNRNGFTGSIWSLSTFSTKNFELKKIPGTEIPISETIFLETRPALSSNDTPIEPVDSSEDIMALKVQAH